MSSVQTKVSERTVVQRIGATPPQNKFLLLYSILYEADYRFTSVQYADAITKEEARQKMEKITNQCQIDNLRSAMGYDDSETFIKDLKISTRFDIDDDGHITIK